MDQKTDFRLYELDNFRGFAIVLLALFFFYETMPFAPQWLLHATDGAGLHFSDFIAPLFMFALGFSAVIGYRKGLKQVGRKATVVRYIRRYFVLIGIGFMVVAFTQVIDGLQSNVTPIIQMQFNVFSAFGVSGLISPAVLRIETGQQADNRDCVYPWLSIFIVDSLR